MSESSPSVPWYRAAWLPPVLLALLGMAAYANTFDVPFARDDFLRIRDDTAIRQFPDCVVHTARPVLNLTLYLNYRLHGLNVAGYHVVNLLIHLLAGLVLYGLIRRTQQRMQSAPVDSTAPSWTAFAAAAIWLVHPIQTEAVTYVIQRSESLMGLFYLSSMYAFARAQNCVRSNDWLYASLLFAFLAAAVKPVAATLPIAVLLYDRAYASGTFRAALRARAPYYTGMAAMWLLLGSLLLVSRESVATAGLGARIIPPWQYLLTQSGVVLHYFRLAVWPAGLCFDYAWPAADRILDVLPQLAAVTSVMAVSLVLYYRFPRAGFPLLFMFLALSVSSSIVPIAHYAVEHRMYLPLAGLAVGTVFAVRRVLPGFCVLRAGLAGLLIVAMTAATLLRNHDYRSPERLWQSVMAVRPDNPVPYSVLATHRNHAQRFAEAAALARQALDRVPPFPALSREQIVARLKSPRGYETLDQLFIYVESVGDLGYAAVRSGRPHEAERHYREAIRVMPEAVNPHFNLAALLAARGDLRGALDELRIVLRFEPGHSVARQRMEQILRHLRKNP